MNIIREAEKETPLLCDGHRTVGKYTLREDDIYGTRTFEDSIWTPLPDGPHHFKFNVPPYDIPYRRIVFCDLTIFWRQGMVDRAGGGCRICAPRKRMGRRLSNQRITGALA
ncbi:hypothetical protein [Christensenella hongkongensis]|uniref:Uncharacterized protein n=1 Tax=Christensenella hongkongensis TaxID=270498 RepID=A0A0M2NCZ7_9FIRM|nr:hypothetical protein [Christensenella hongkongensis]KKI50083.1 hypothetical protein CHK_2146 [Christensenella hongkongensis]